METTEYAAKCAAQIREPSAYALAVLAAVAAPDRQVSPGARFLLGVAEATAEAVEFLNPQLPEDLPRDWWDETEGQVADGAVPVYNHDRWATVGDLAAWDEDISAFGTPPDLIEGCGWVLYEVAQRLVCALADLVIEKEE